MTETMQAADFEQMLDGGNPRCQMPKAREERHRFLLWSVRQLLFEPGNPLCGLPAFQRVQMRCPCTTQTGWVCRDHLAVLRDPRARATCMQDHPAELVFL